MQPSVTAANYLLQAIYSVHVHCLCGLVWATACMAALKNSYRQWRPLIGYSYGNTNVM